MDNKAQPSLEFLITYGWALLIVVIVGSVLFSLGVFNPKASVSWVASGLEDFHIEDVSLRRDVFYITLGPKTGETTRIEDIDWQVEEIPNCNNIDNNIADTNIYPSKNTKFTLLRNETSDCSAVNSGEKYKLNITINYVTLTGDLSHSQTGRIIIQSES